VFLVRRPNVNPPLRCGGRRMAIGILSGVFEITMSHEVFDARLGSPAAAKRPAGGRTR
jgi:hypothetical protein